MLMKRIPMMIMTVCQMIRMMTLVGMTTTRTMGMATMTTQVVSQMVTAVMVGSKLTGLTGAWLNTEATR